MNDRTVAPRVCVHCSQAGDLRPYAPGGALVCFTFAMSSPARRTQAEQAFATQLDACGAVALVDGTERGPYPAANHPAVAQRLSFDQASEAARLTQ